MTRRKRRLWTCPRCRHKFVTRNMSHSCGRYRVLDHFRGKDPLVRHLFLELKKQVLSVGRARVYAQKTRIVFQTRGRFASVQVRRKWLDIGLWLKRRREHDRLFKIEFYPPSDHVHRIRLAEPSDIDRTLLSFVREAYKVGRQEWGNPRSM